MGATPNINMAAAAPFLYRFVALPVGSAWLVTYKVTEQGTGLLLRDDHSKYGYNRLCVGYLAGIGCAAGYLTARNVLHMPKVAGATTQMETSWNPIQMAKNLSRQFPKEMLRFYGINFFTSAMVAGLGCSLTLKYVVGHPAVSEPTSAPVVPRE